MSQPNPPDIFQKTLTQILIDYEAKRKIEDSAFVNLGKQIFDLYRSPLLIIARRIGARGNHEEIVDTFLSIVLVEGFVRDGSPRDQDRKYKQPAKSLIARFLEIKRDAAAAGYPPPSFRAFLQTRFRAFLHEYQKAGSGNGRAVALPATARDVETLLSSESDTEQFNQGERQPSEEFETLEMKAFIVQAFDAAYKAAREGWTNKGFVVELHRRYPDAAVLLAPKFAISDGDKQALQQAGGISEHVSPVVTKFKARLEQELLLLLRDQLTPNELAYFQGLFRSPTRKRAL